MDVRRLHVRCPVEHAGDQFHELFRLVRSVDDDPDALLPARYSRVGHRRAGVSELAQVGRERGRMLREDGEDRADDVAREVWRCASRAEREEAWRDALEPFVQETVEVFGDASQTFSSLSRRAVSPRMIRALCRSDGAHLIASTALDVVERGVQEADRRAWHRRGENEGPAVVDDVMPHGCGRKENGCLKVSTTYRTF